MTRKLFGYRRDHVDHRDHAYEAKVTAFPDSVNLLAADPLHVNQRSIGSCVANALVEDDWLAMRRNGVTTPAVLSRLYIYYWARAIENSINSDSGCEIRDAVKVLAKRGAPPEHDWPYHLGALYVHPTDHAELLAPTNKITGYKRVPVTRDGILGCLASGDTFVSGLTLFESFENVGSDGLYLPGHSEAVIGGHAMLAGGYDATPRFAEPMVLHRNSWSRTWGANGDVWVPLRIMLRDGGDFWSILR